MLAGGSGRRLAGSGKPELLVDGRRLIDTVLAACGSALVVVVSPPRAGLGDAVTVREDPPGGGPAAALATGIRALLEISADQPADRFTAVLAADLPGISASLLHRLGALLQQTPLAAGALALDPTGRRQLLVGVWRLEPLAAAARRRPDWSGLALSWLLADLEVVELPAGWPEVGDVDTADDLARWRAAGPETRSTPDRTADPSARPAGG